VGKTIKGAARSAAIGRAELPWVWSVRRPLVEHPSRRWGRLLLFVVFLASVLLRFEDLGHWTAGSGYFFYQGEPFILSPDGYYYLRLAEDLSRHEYLAVDDLRTAPEGASRPAVIPLLSFLVYLLKAALPLVSFNYLAVALPPFLGALVVFPVWGICRGLGLSIFSSLVACVSSSLSVTYFNRTRLGYFDTDGLVLVLTLLICHLFFRFSDPDNRRRYWYYGGAVGALLLFLWLWDGVPFIVLSIFAVPLLASLLFFYRAARRERYSFYAILLALALLAALLFAKQLPSALEDTLDAVRVVTGVASTHFPDTSKNVTELTRPGFLELGAGTAGSMIGFLAGAAGLLLLVKEHPRKAAMIAMPCVLGVLSLLLGRRFLIFLGAAVAIGTGFGVERIIRTRLRHVFLGSCLVLLALWYLNVTAATAGVTASRATFNMFPGTDRLKQVTAPKSIIWSDVDSGYLIMYWAKRRTIADPDRIDGEHQFYTYFPLSAESPRLAANFMRFYGARGRPGLHRIYALCGGDIPSAFRLVSRILEAGPDDAGRLLSALPPGMAREGDADAWRAFFFPRGPLKIYLFLHANLLEFVDTWFQYGSWDLERSRGTVGALQVFRNVRRRGDTIAIGDVGIEFNLDQGTTADLSTGGHEMPLAHVMEYDGQTRHYKDYGHRDGYALEYVTAPGGAAGFGALMTLPVARSLFASLYFRHEASGEYFRPVLLQTPEFQVWEVLGDTLAARGGGR